MSRGKPKKNVIIYKLCVISESRKETWRLVSAQPAPSRFESDSVVCSSTNRNNGRTAWDAKDYSDQKELPYEITHRWIRVSQKTLKCIDSHIAFATG